MIKEQIDQQPRGGLDVIAMLQLPQYYETVYRDKLTVFRSFMTTDSNTI
jgi:hypothetical protein